MTADVLAAIIACVTLAYIAGALVERAARKDGGAPSGEPKWRFTCNDCGTELRFKRGVPYCPNSKCARNKK